MTPIKLVAQHLIGYIHFRQPPTSKQFSKSNGHVSKTIVLQNSGLGDEIADKDLRPWQYPIRALMIRDYAKLWTATLLQVSGFQMQAIAQGYLIYDLTGSAKNLGLISLATAVPLLLLSPIGGVVADRVGRKYLIQIGQSLSAIGAGFIAITLITGTLMWPYLLIVAALQGTTWAFIGPARQAYIPQLVGRDKMSNAVALLAAGISLPALFAPALAGTLYALWGAETVYVFQIIGLFFAFWLTCSIQKSGSGNAINRSGMISDLREGFSYLSHNSKLRTLLTTLTFILLFSIPLMSLLPVLVVEQYQMEVGFYGILVSISGVGSLLGAILIAILPKGKRGYMMIGALFVSGVSHLLLASVPYALVGLVVMVAVGLGGSGHWALGQVLIMDNVDDIHRARIMSILTMLFGLMPFAVMPAAFAADYVGVDIVIGSLGIALISICLIILIGNNELKRIP